MQVVKRYFNSTMVRLKDSRYVSTIYARVFQFHYGTIKRFCRPFVAHSSFYFNSTMVRLKAEDCIVAASIGAHFNSTMVRLKDRAEFFICFIYLFQFHYGTIKRSYTFFARFKESNFNSTMVRLKGRYIYKPLIYCLISIPLWYD